jgi:hypothetical protein
MDYATHHAVTPADALLIAIGVCGSLAVEVEHVPAIVILQPPLKHQDSRILIPAIKAVILDDGFWWK